MGYYALALMVMSIFAGMAAFYSMKMIFRIPLLLNLPGAFLIWMGIFLLTGMATHDMFAGHVGYPEPPVIEVSKPLTALVLAVIWYVCIIVIEATLKRGNIPPSHGCLIESCSWDGPQDGSAVIGQCKSCKNVR